MQEIGKVTPMSSKQAITETRWRESTSGSIDRIDREKGTIYGARLIGTTSRNGRRYLRDALAEAIPLYEGSKVYVDHVDNDKAPKDRPMRERWGRIRGVRQGEDGALYGDIDYLKSHTLTDPLLEAAERFDDWGLSHDAAGETRREGGELVCYKINRVYSVDLVTSPATNTNLFESEQMSKTVLQTLREHEKSVKLAGPLLKRLKEMGDEMYNEAMPMMGEMAAETSPEDQVDSAFKSAVMAVLDMDKDLPTKIGLIKKILSVHEEVIGAGSGGAPAGGESEPTVPPPESDPTMTESEKKLADENKQLRESLLKATIERKLVDSGREPTPVIVKACMTLQESECDEFIKTLPAKAGSDRSKPSSSPSRFQESGDQGDKPLDVNGMKKLLGVGK